eukprot:scaffold320901_cov17-Tisochrysis_lutea.AAC.1
MEAGCLQCSSSCQFVVNTSRICLSERSDCKSRAASRKDACELQQAAWDAGGMLREQAEDQGEMSGPGIGTRERDQVAESSRGIKQSDQAEGGLLRDLST